MLTIDYNNAIHPKCGKEVQTYKDIIVTPFYTEKFCDEIVKMAQFYDKKFSPYIYYILDRSSKKSDNSPWDTLLFSRISQILFENFCDHYKKYICPLLEKTFFPETISGWFSPMIIKYSKKGQKVKLHNDISLFTLNVKLNTNYKGCHVEFPRQQWNNKDLPKGWCMIWPSQVTHPHQSQPLLKGTKYTLSAWTHPPTWTVDGHGGSIFYENVT